MAFFGLFGKKKRTLDDVTLDDLTRERVSLQQEQRKLDLEMDRLDKDETQLKSEYAEAGTPTQKKMIARKIQDVRMRRKASDTKSSHCHKMLQTVNNFTVIKENIAFFDRMGVASALVNMDLAEIENFINEATVEGTLQQEKLATMLQQVSDGVDQISAGAGDESLDDLMAELDGEVSADTQTVSSQSSEDDVDKVMGELDAAMRKGEQLAKEAQQPAKQPESES